MHRSKAVTEEWQPECDVCVQRHGDADIVEIYYGVIDGELPEGTIYGGWPTKGWDPTHLCRTCGAHLLDPADPDYELFLSTRPER